MAEHLSYQHAVNAIRLIYKNRGFDVEQDTPGEQVYREFKVDASVTRLAALYAFVDEQIALLRVLLGTSFRLCLCLSQLP